MLYFILIFFICVFGYMEVQFYKLYSVGFMPTLMTGCLIGGAFGLIVLIWGLWRTYKNAQAEKARQEAEAEAQRRAERG